MRTEVRDSHTNNQDGKTHQISREKCKHSHDLTETQAYADRTFDGKGPERAVTQRSH